LGPLFVRLFSALSANLSSSLLHASWTKSPVGPKRQRPRGRRVRGGRRGASVRAVRFCLSGTRCRRSTDAVARRVQADRHGDGTWRSV